MARVLLIRPKSAIPITNFPLGLMYLASSLEKMGHSVEILDLRFPESSSSEAVERMVDFRPDIVGVGSMTAEDKGLREILQGIKKTSYKPMIVVGGPHASTYLDRIMKYDGVDGAVLHEGEQTIVEIAQGKSLNNILGIAYQRNGSYVVNQNRGVIVNLDNIPYPAYHLIDMERYFKNPFVHGFVLKHPRLAQMVTSRGCPYVCIYCHNIFGKQFRARSTENVFGEIKFLYEKYNIQEIHFEDDSFNANPKRAEKILDRIIQSGVRLNFSFPNGLRADLLDENFILKMKKAGVYQVSVGIESADPDIQKTLGKKIDLERVFWSIKGMSRQGIITDGFFMLGFLNETKEQMLRTIRFARSSHLHLATFHKVNPFPGTSLGHQAEEKGHCLNIESFGADGYRFGKINISAVDQKTLDWLQKKAYFLFFAKLNRLWKIFFLAPNKRTLFKHFLRMIFWR